jgi:hypothetical protein
MRYQAASGYEIPRDQRIQIITLKDITHWPFEQIGAELALPAATCRRIYNKFHAAGTPSRRRRSGRPPLFNAQVKRELVAFITQNRFTRRLSYEDIITIRSYDCSPRTLRRVLASLGFHKRVPRRKFHVRPENQALRVAWALEHLYWTREDWLRVVFTDESTFSTAGHAFRQPVFRRADEEYHPDCISTTHWSGRKSQMIWGGYLRWL